MVDYYSYKMSGSEEEFEHQMTQGGMTKAELRRVISIIIILISNAIKAPAFIESVD